MIKSNPRVLFFLGLLLILFGFSTSAYAQLPSKSQHLNIQDTLNGIAKQFKVNFIYESNLFKGNNIEAEKSGPPKGKNLEARLSALLKPVWVGYYRVDKNNYALFSLLSKKSGLGKPPLNTNGSSRDKSFSIYGAVLDSSGKPLEYSSVYLLGNDSIAVAAVIADQDGRFSFVGIDAGKYSLRATRIGYHSTHSPVLLFTASQNVQKDLLLEEAPRQLRQVLVNSNRPLFEFHADRTIVNVQGSFVGSGLSVSNILEVSPGLMLANGAYSLKGITGVGVMIDGNLINLPHSQLSALLRGIPVSSVSQIELIHSPSAKYDAQGKAALINIKLLTSQSRGLAGSINAGFSMGSQPRFTHNAALNYSGEKISLFGNYSYQNIDSRSGFSSENIAVNTLPVAYQQRQTIKQASVIHSAMLGASYQVNQKNNVSIKGSLVSDKSSSAFLRALSLPDSSIRSLGKGSPAFNSQTLNFSSSHTLGSAGGLLALHADYTSYKSNNPEKYQNSFLGALGKVARPVEYLNSKGNVNLDIYSAGLDYTYPFINGHQLEAGAKLDFTHSDSKVLYQYGNLDTQLLTDFSRTNSFRYREEITSAYLNYHGKIGATTTLQLGLRAENTVYSSAAISGDQATAQSYIQVFPSFLLSYGKEKQVFTFSYHRSLGRPSYQDLNPFITYFSPFQYAMGNQFLLPETTHSLRLGFSYAQVINFSLGYNHTVNYLGTVASLNAGSLTTRESIGNFGNYGLLRLSADYQKTVDWYWKIGVNTNIFQDHYHGSYLGRALKNSLIGFNLNIINTFQLDQKLTAEVQQRYQSKRAALAGVDFGRYRADAALKYGLLNGKAELRLAVNDIFYSYLDKGIRSFGELYSNYSNKNENRRFHIGLSYFFGRNSLRETQMTTKQQESERIK
ncbi:MAG: TonB dependent receptor [Bacteroidota bacterium]